jgi:RNA polymerase sigma-70 factor (ECF subfamily)
VSCSLTAVASPALRWDWRRGGVRLRRSGWRVDTGPVIGAAFGFILAKAQAGDEAAFSSIFRDVQPALLRYLRVITPDADDVAGETWAQVVAGLAGFRGEEQAFRAWLFTIARHRAIDVARHRARRPTVPLEGSGAEHLASADAADAALEALSLHTVMALMAELPREQAEVIMLRVVAGLEAPEVARIVGRSPGAVRVAAHRGLRRLADLAERVGVTR